MRELTVKIQFTNPSLGNQKGPNGRYTFQRSLDNKILFLPTWHYSNMVLAADMLGRHQETVKKICWDIEIDAKLHPNCFARHYYPKTNNGKERWSVHESLKTGQTIGLNCIVPSEIDDADFWSLLQIAGKYKGLSPWQPGQYGHYQVVEFHLRRQKFKE